MRARWLSVVPDIDEPEVLPEAVDEPAEVATARQTLADAAAALSEAKRAAERDAEAWAVRIRTAELRVTEAALRVVALQKDNDERVRG